MSEKTNQELIKLTNEDLDKILSPLRFLIQELPNSIEVMRGMLESSDKDECYILENLYSKKLYSSEVNNILLNLEKSINPNDFTLENSIRVRQRQYILVYYENATNINDYLNQLTILLSKLKDKEVLRELLVGKVYLQ